MGIIYIIKNRINDKVYVGQTTQSLQERYNKHLSDAKYKNTHLYRAMRKYGADNFYCEVLEDNLSIEQLDQQETYWIKFYDSYKNGYNSTLGGQKTHYGYDRKLILSLWQQGYFQTEIAEIIGCSTRIIHDTLRQNGVEAKNCYERVKQRYKKFTPKEALELWNQGLSVNQIHTIYGSKQSLIKEDLINAGVTLEEINNRHKENQQQSGMKNLPKNLTTKVYQFDLEGKLIKQYDSISEAVKATQINSANISHCCSGDIITAGGYVWLYNNNQSDVNERIKKKKDSFSKIKKQVFQYSKDNKFVASYDSIAEAAKAVGLKSQSSISGILDNPNRCSKGYHWYTHKIDEEI